ncbi:RNA-directed DNA polymerase [Pseudonocardia sp. ICBG1122]|nr:RNA-directed DNA polymerase [Pseudonocardia pini]
MISDSPHQYRLQGASREVPAQVIENSIAQAQVTESRNLRAVLSLKHLAHQTGCSYIYLREIVQRVRDPYSTFSRRRRSGVRMRSISSPNPPLMAVQRWILRNILNHVDPHPSSFAYQRNRSIVQCASRHIGADWLLKLDLFDYFPSISEEVVYWEFRRSGYSRLVAFELARICTRPTNESPPIRSRSKYRAIPSYASAKEAGILPQGAPTSGAIANLVSRQLDISLTRLANASGLTYTRYSDDLVFSGTGPLNRDTATQKIREIDNIISSCGFETHRKKTRIVTPGGSKDCSGPSSNSVRSPTASRVQAKDQDTHSRR